MSCVLLLIVSTIFAARFHVGRLFTQDVAVLEVVATVLAIVPIFGFLDGFAAVSCERSCDS